MTESSQKSPSGVNTVIPHDDYVEVIWDGPQNADKVRQNNFDVLHASETLKTKGKPVLLILTIQNHPLLPNLGAFREVLKIFQAIEFDRLAITGDIPPRIMSLVTTTISSFNKQLEIKYIADPDQALTWLKSYTNNS